MDPIADMLTRIRNASAAHNTATVIPYSKIKYAIAEILAREGWIESVGKYAKKGKRQFDIALDEKNRPLSGVRRISKPSKRIYRGWQELRPVRQGYGMSVISTPKGLLTDKEARKSKVGGEVLLEIW